MKKRSIVTIKVIVEHDDEFDCNELGIVWLMEDRIVDCIVPVLKDEHFNIIDYVSQDIETIEEWE